MVKRLTQTLLVLSVLSAGPVLADGSTSIAPAPVEPSTSVTGNAELASDYVFRGLTQTWGRPALQAGADLSMPGGFAAGVWGSNVAQDVFPGGTLEIDLYASYGKAFSDDWSWRVGLYTYNYPGANLDQAQVPLPSHSFDTQELNAALTWKWLTLKYSRSLSDYFAVGPEQGYRDDSKGTSYLQLDASLPLNDAWSLALHAGHTSYTTQLVVPLLDGAKDPSYSDYGASLKWQFSPVWSLTAGMSFAGNDAFYAHTASFKDFSDVKDVGGSRGYLLLQATF